MPHTGLIISILLILNIEVNKYYIVLSQDLYYLQSVYRMYCSFLISGCQKLKYIIKLQVYII